MPVLLERFSERFFDLQFINEKFCVMTFLDRGSTIGFMSLFHIVKLTVDGVEVKR